MRIGINALYLIPGRVGGTEIYLQSLLRAVARVDSVNEYFLYLNAEAAEENPAANSPNIHSVPCNIRAEFRPGRIAWEQTALLCRLRKDRIDVLFNPGFTSPVLFTGPSVTVFHDLQYKRHPEWFRWFDLPFWRLLTWFSVVRSRALIAVSPATADDLVSYYPRAAGKTIVIPHGVDPEFFRIGERRRTLGAPRNAYILTVSTLHPHKNLDSLMKAFLLFRSGHPEFGLIIAGMKGFAHGGLESCRRELGLVDAVTFTGWIPRPDLYRLFEDATAFIAPSRFEGFGMPILEALAAGIPSACSDIAPLREIAGSAAARFDPLDVAEIAAAMELITQDTGFRSRAIAGGPEQARKSDWDDTARLTVGTIENVMRARGSHGLPSV